MRTQSFLIIVILGFISFSCCGSRQAASTDTSTQRPITPIIETDDDETDNDGMDGWSSQPDSNSSRIKVSNAAIMFNSLPNGLSRMGYGIAENTGNSITTTVRGDIQITAWIDGQDVILASQVQQYTDNGFGLREPSELVSCVKGDATSIPDCWRTILIIANRIGGTKQYQ
ncbi:hypothetical protein [Kordia sp.]|uniref:hypothetical protein n=1 Tax=Kordia sp. TaxID=1965332 RepID=UPI003B5A05F7